MITTGISIDYKEEKENFGGDFFVNEHFGYLYRYIWEDGKEVEAGVGWGLLGAPWMMVGPQHRLMEQKEHVQQCSCPPPHSIPSPEPSVTLT